MADEPGVLARSPQVLATHGVSVKSVVQKGLDEQARLVMVVHPVLESRFQAAMAEIAGLDVLRAPPRAIRVLEEEFGWRVARHESHADHRADRARDGAPAGGRGGARGRRTRYSPGQRVLVDVKAAGVSFPEVLQTRGEYQLKPPLPFMPGSEVAGTVRSAPEDSDLEPGDRVAAFCFLGGFAEVAVAPAHFTFPLPEELSFAQGAGAGPQLPHGVFRAAHPGRLTAGETVLVHGAAGGVGTAALQVAKALGARTIAVVSTDEKAQIVTRRRRRPCAALHRSLEGRGTRAGWRRRRGRPGRRRPVHRQPALDEGERPAVGGRFHRRIDT